MLVKLLQVPGSAGSVTDVRNSSSVARRLKRLFGKGGPSAAVRPKSDPGSLSSPKSAVWVLVSHAASKVQARPAGELQVEAYGAVISDRAVSCMCFKLWRLEHAGVTLRHCARREVRTTDAGIKEGRDQPPVGCRRSPLGAKKGLVDGREGCECEEVRKSQRPPVLASWWTHGPVWSPWTTIGACRGRPRPLPSRALPLHQPASSCPLAMRRPPSQHRPKSLCSSGRAPLLPRPVHFGRSTPQDQAWARGPWGRVGRGPTLRRMARTQTVAWWCLLRHRRLGAPHWLGLGIRGDCKVCVCGSPEAPTICEGITPVDLCVSARHVRHTPAWTISAAPHVFDVSLLCD